MSYKDTVAKKKQFLIDQIPSEWIIAAIKSPEEEPNVNAYIESPKYGLLTPREIEITNLTLDDLLTRQLNHTLTAVEIAEAFIHRATLVHQITNCCTEFFFQHAYTQAHYLDDYLNKHGKLVGPFHGIPVSLKDQLNVKGVATSIGYVGKLFKVIDDEHDEAVLVKQLRSQGALMYMKTTVPLGMLICDTFSTAYGYTQNALNRQYSPGGSSGGEGVVIQAKACVLGIGTDIGGSLRCPAIYNGIWSIRPTTNRFSYMNCLNSFQEQEIVASTIGPMANTLEDLVYFGENILGEDSLQWTLDPKVLPLKWNKNVEIPKKLSFAVMNWNKIAMPHPPMIRALEMVKSALLEQGHELIEWDPPVSDMELYEFIVEAYGVDGYEEMKRETKISGEPFELSQLYSFEDELKAINCVEQYWELSAKRYKYQQIFNEYWLSTAKRTSTGRPIDGLLTPGWHCCAVKLGQIPNFNADYAVQFNVLDVPAIPIPITKADSKIDVKDSSYKPVNAYDQDCYDRYDAEFFHGANSSVQLVGLQRYTEEKVLKIAGVIKDLVDDKYK